YFGAWVTLVDETDQQCRYRILGADEFDRDSDGISVDSPMARALLGRAVDDEVQVRTPQGEKTFWIEKIDY
ncbi:MAG: GreA/GreB family elongation factor, partial [Gammaproteobacteria bacterium]|nr:GreA/GreB family elongation factor [Gammaproteobacteria bacterium]